MRIVQFELPGSGRRLGVVEGHALCDVTSVRPDWMRVVDACQVAFAEQVRLPELLQGVIEKAQRLEYAPLLSSSPASGQPFLHPPFDLADPSRLRITGTGLTHLGSMKSRDEMHSEDTEAEVTDSRRMFEMGVEGGRPSVGTRGVAPEWFYKGCGTSLRGPNTELTIPSFTEDGGEEAEVVGIYLIDAEGQPRRLGFALGNEWSDHTVERVNYLYLAPSKLRTCSVGPELITDNEFQDIEVRCRVRRKNELIYDSGPLRTGQQNMCHSLANCEDHHFKYAEHRRPGDGHLHFFGTSKLSYGEREWNYAEGDEIEVSSPGFSSPLVNRVRREPADPKPVTVRWG